MDQIDSSAAVKFPRVCKIFEHRTDLVHEVARTIEERLKEKDKKIILFVSGTGATQHFAAVYEKLLKRRWQLEIKSKDVDIQPVQISNAPTLQSVNDVCKAIADKKPNALLYIGAQSIGDVCKHAIYKCQKREPSEKILFGGIFTALSGDGLLSEGASIRDQRGIPSSERGVAPELMMVGHRLTLLRQPYGLMLSCVGDVLSKPSSLWDYEYSCRVIEKSHHDVAVHLVKHSYMSLLHNPPKREDELHQPEMLDELFRDVQLSGISMQLTRSSEVCSGSEHVGEKLLQEYIIEHGIPGRPSHGVVLTPMVLTTLHLQGQCGIARQIRDIAQKRDDHGIGLATTAKELFVTPKAFQLCLGLGYGLRCPRYLRHLLLDAKKPVGYGHEKQRVTVLEEIELGALLSTIEAAMIASGVAKPEDFFKALGSTEVAALRNIADRRLPKEDMALMETSMYKELLEEATNEIATEEAGQKGVASLLADPNQYPRIGAEAQKEAMQRCKSIIAVMRNTFERSYPDVFN